MKNLYFRKKIPVEKLIPKRENKTAKQEEQKAVAKIAEKIPDKVPRIPINIFLPELRQNTFLLPECVPNRLPELRPNF